MKIHLRFPLFLKQKHFAFIAAVVAMHTLAATVARAQFPTAGPSYTPSVTVIQGNQPLVAGSQVLAGSDPYTFTITAPSAVGALPASAYPITINLQVTIPANYGGFPGIPVGANALVAVNWCTLSTTSVTFTAPQSSAQVTVYLNVPTPVVSGDYYWNVKGTNWPQGIVDQGFTVNATVRPPVTDTTVKPTITNVVPIDGSTFLYDPPATGPISFTISFDANVNPPTGGGVLQGLKANFDGLPFNGVTQYNGSTLAPLTVTGLGSYSGHGVVTSPPITDAGPHTITLAATNTGGTTEATTTINIQAPPKITTSPLSATLTYGQGGSFTIAATGYPKPDLSATNLPTGVTFTPGTGAAQGTGVLTVAPTASVSPTAYTITLTATNTVGTPAAQRTDTKTFLLTINKAPLTLTATSATKVYGSGNPPLTATLSGFVQGETLATSGVTGAAVVSTTATTGSGVGGYPIIPAVGTLSAANYTFTTLVSGTLTVTPAPLTITANSATKIYGAPMPALSATYTGFVNGDTAAVVSGLTLTTPATSASPAGSYAITPASATASNYAITYVAGVLTVTKAALTVTADNKTMTAGGALPAFTATFGGLVNGDTPAVVSPLTFSTTATTASPAGTYPISVSGPASTASYNVTYAAGTLTITPSSPPPPTACGTAIVRHGPDLNGNAGIDGSLQVLTAEKFSLDGNVWISHDLLVPGTPTVNANGHPTIGGVTDGTGSASPSNYTITLNGNPALGHIVRHTDPVAIPVINTPPAPTGTRDVKLSSADDRVGTFGNVRDLTVSGNFGQLAVPPGTYRDLTASGSSGFTLGVAGATAPAVYYVRNLKLSGNGTLKIVGPVILTVTDDFTFNGTVGNTNHPEWLVLNLFSGDLTLNGTVHLFGSVLAPFGTVRFDGQATLCTGSNGYLKCDRLIMNGFALLDLCRCSGHDTGHHDGDDDDDHSDHDGKKSSDDHGDHGDD